ncbi:hypothetical protein GQ42DRAFT_179959 [Ramicandelaber brevisporus]|nr:hypothetical protein GQ42DRAFT_179959 [Ramicandelaber brevisporus]
MDQLVTTNTPVAHPACKFSTQLYSYLNSTAFSAIRWSESGRHVIVVDTDLLDSQLKAFGKPGELTMYSSLRRQFTGYHFTRSSATLLPAHEIPAGVHPTGKSCVWQHPDFTRTANNLSKRAGRVGTLVSCVAQSGSSNGLGKIADAGRTLVRRLTDKLTDKVESVWRSASSSSKPQSEPQSDDDVSDTSSSCSLVASEKEPLGYMFPPAVSHERSILPSIVAPCDLISPGHLGVPTAISSSAVSLNHVQTLSVEAL